MVFEFLGNRRRAKIRKGLFSSTWIEIPRQNLPICVFWNDFFASCGYGRPQGNAELLIDNSADVNATTNRGTTPLDEAIFGNHSEIAELLRKHGGKTKKELEAEAR